MVSIIAAVARNRVIGRAGGIPWDIPEDRRRFRALTMGHTLVMGRKTFESIGKPLAGRNCIILSRQPGYSVPGCRVIGSIEEALSLCPESEELFVAGGAEIYREFLPLAQRLYISLVGLDPDGDAEFPEIPAVEFVEISREQLAADPPCLLVTYERRSSGRGKV
ncbi:dihydrofolate reductase [Geobacter sp. OR-1]|uniref:dihydrofolate reductase n=1 Tax=Geobacter sp. OR-1 TaxID=1266765 RepID=UPI000541F0E5|nr:dihydrofolate reductase [Geobacter sp. OR-1]GAM09808.1 dihydrofolate reductase [Geobacter sp. OR-1]